MNPVEEKPPVWDALRRLGDFDRVNAQKIPEQSRKLTANVSQHAETASARGQGLKLERRKSAHSEQKQNESKRKLGLFECEGRALRESITNLNMKSINHALKLIDHTLIKIGNNNNPIMTLQFLPVYA